MTKKDKEKKHSNEFIKRPPSQKISIDKCAVEKSEYPLFCFKYLQEHSIKKCKNIKFLLDYLFRLKSLSELGWKEIEKSDRHSFGTEQLPKENIKPDISLVPILTDDVEKVCVFRASGNNHSFIGLRENSIFHVIYIEANFGDIYNH